MAIATYQMKLLNPETRIHTPVKCTTLARSELNASMSCGNIGANDSGPVPWLKETAVAQVKVDTFQKVFQFCSHAINDTALSKSDISYGDAYERIVRIIRGLRYQYSIRSSGGPDEVMRAHIDHDLRALNQFLSLGKLSFVILKLTGRSRHKLLLQLIGRLLHRQ